jgi:hypothetical protein
VDEFVERKKPTGPMEKYIPYEAREDDVPPKPTFNTGYKIPVISQAKKIPLVEFEKTLDLIPALEKLFAKW